jgi:phage-related protein
MISPVYVLTAGEVLGAITVKLENVSTDEELQWTGTLTTADELTIDVPNWIVYKNGTASMSGVTGQFPRLQPGANSIKVTAMAVTGLMDITYRNTFL